MIDFIPMMSNWHAFAMSNWYTIHSRGEQLLIDYADNMPVSFMEAMTIRRADVNTTCYLICATEAYKSGMKTIVPKAEQCFVFENIEPKIPMRNYNQPYPTVIIEYPEEYRSALMGRHRTRTPLCTFSHWRPDIPTLIVCNFYGRNYPVVVFYITQNAADKTIEEAINFISNRRHHDIDYVVANDTLRMIINLNLFATGFGFQKLGYKNPKQHRFLERKKPLEAKRDFYYFGLNQEVKLYRKETYKSESGDGTHESPHPHWRKGHYRHQPYGPGNSLRKLIMIPPVFVCGDKYLGGLDTTSVTMKG